LFPTRRVLRVGSSRQNMPVQPGRFFFSVTSTVSADTGGDCSGVAAAFAVVVGTALSLLRQEPIVDVCMRCGKVCGWMMSLTPLLAVCVL
jgi:hypothetical protein